MFALLMNSGLILQWNGIPVAQAVPIGESRPPPSYGEITNPAYGQNTGYAAQAAMPMGPYQGQAFGPPQNGPPVHPAAFGVCRGCGKHREFGGDTLCTKWSDVC